MHGPTLHNGGTWNLAQGHMAPKGLSQDFIIQSGCRLLFCSADDNMQIEDLQFCRAAVTIAPLSVLALFQLLALSSNSLPALFPACSMATGMC